MSRVANTRREELDWSASISAPRDIQSDDPPDLSTLPYDRFRADYAAIIRNCVALSKPDRFACFVVGDVRDRRGHDRNLPGHAIDAFQAAAAALDNEAVPETTAGSLPIRVGRQFETARKLGKTHQTVLVFVKGDAKRAAAAVGVPEFGELPTDRLDEAPA